MFEFGLLFSNVSISSLMNYFLLNILYKTTENYLLIMTHLGIINDGFNAKIENKNRIFR